MSQDLPHLSGQSFGSLYVTAMTVWTLNMEMMQSLPTGSQSGLSIAYT